MRSKILLPAVLSLTLLILASGQARASYLYGNGEVSRQIVVDKQVKPEAWGDWKDNLSSEIYTFVAEEKVNYKLVVKNTGEEDLSQIKVIDYLPDYISFESATEGHSRDGSQVQWAIDKLSPGEEKTFELMAKIADSNTLSGKSNFCPTNRVRAEAESGENDEDTAQICLETRILGAEKAPETGAELVWGIVAALGLTVGGLAIKKLHCQKDP